METNWAGNFRYGAREIRKPESWAEVAELVAHAPRVRALGTRHSFNDLPDSEVLISFANIPREIEIDRERMMVRVDGGVTYAQLGPLLRAAGVALPNLASLPHISVAGAVATGTHGSGVGNGSLSSSVIGLEYLDAEGDTVRLRQDLDPERFPGAVVSMGLLGVVRYLTLRLVPSFDVAQTVYEDVPAPTSAGEMDEMLSGGYSVSFFRDYRQSAIRQVWVKRRAGDEDASVWEGRASADGPRHPLGLDATFCTTQMGEFGPWDERLTHFKSEFTPSHGDELQSEFFVAREDAFAAMRALDELAEEIAPLLYISEVRTIASDDLWLSPSSGRDSVAFHFTWRKEVEGVTALLPSIEARLAPFGARPHWGKIFTSTDVLSRYSRGEDFRRMVHAGDPGGKFRNSFTARLGL